MLAVERNHPSGTLQRFGLSESDVNRLIEALLSADPQTSRAVRAALRELGEAALPSLERAANCDNPAIRGKAQELLRAFPVRSFSCGLR